MRQRTIGTQEAGDIMYWPRKTWRLFFCCCLLVSEAIGQNQDTIIIDHVNVIPMTHEAVLKNQRVVVVGTKIFAIESAKTRNRYNAGKIISGKGKYLIPGLSEMHFHFRSEDIESDLKLLIANGVTTVRNMGEFPGQDHLAIREQTRSGQLPAVNYFTTGPYLTVRDLTTPEVAIETVKLHKSKGYDFLKIADNLPLPVYQALINEAVNQNVAIVGHSQRDKPVDYSLRMKSIEHIEEFLYLTDNDGKPFLKQDTSGLSRLAKQIKNSGIYVGSTLSVFDFIKACLSDERFAAYSKSEMASYLAKKQREDFLTERNDYRKLKDAKFEGVPAQKFFADNFEWMKQFAKILNENSVPILTGSDTYGMVIVGFSLHEEFQFLEESGLKPFEILRASTIVPAQYLKISSTDGTIEAGKNANLVLLDHNPLKGIRHTKEIQGVFLRGKWIDRDEIDRMLSEVRAAFR